MLAVFPKKVFAPKDHKKSKSFCLQKSIIKENHQYKSNKVIDHSTCQYNCGMCLSSYNIPTHLGHFSFMQCRRKWLSWKIKQSQLEKEKERATNKKAEEVISAKVENKNKTNQRKITLPVIALSSTSTTPSLIMQSAGTVPPSGSSTKSPNWKNKSTQTKHPQETKRMKENEREDKEREWKNKKNEPGTSLVASKLWSHLPSR